MAISLTKGKPLSLTKESPGLTKIFMGLGWDPVEQKGGFLKKMFGGGASEIDLDASAVLFDKNKAAIDLVFFQQLNSRDGSIKHGGDNLTGEGDGDDEVIYVDLAKLPANVEHLVFTVNSFRGQSFDEVENAFARLVDHTKNQEICRYDLKEKGRHTGVVMASMSKENGGWTMTAHGTPCQGRTAKDIIDDAVRVI
ncbi:TerD family protein [Pseudovibrio sp. Tun.PSC04-5.I4]|uniref:TerD family protein n=1 Tax=Pseudovibrio sp. Tun.PSC04-5.I4 TaxID=1798213 RepID=UPI00088E5796|nr:TerD family protein [Pseudovibrio sp. Tun.PSC04-5.I4]SDQ86173.1 tellurium resistance protein TerZ [Pseudovibrio sp. Tun.PSC04-5.I4]